jgi:RHS repeat-associated protein
MNVTDGTGSVLTRYYLGGRYELDITLGNTREKLYLGGDAYSAPMVYVRDSNSDWVLYDIVRDYQGSITHLVDDSDGTVVAEYSYDPWGRLRDPQTLEIYTPGSSTMPELMIGRGYTAHEHLDWFGLINMNARLYDPAIGRFLSPDPYVQAPGFTQN